MNLTQNNGTSKLGENKEMSELRCLLFLILFTVKESKSENSNLKMLEL